MLFRFLCCFLSLIQTGWSANEYRLKNSRHAEYSISLQPQNEQQSRAPVVYQKEYFFFSAPEDKTDETKALENPLFPVKRSQQILFIKAPVDDAFEMAFENLVQNTAQQNTHIYIFSKEPNYAGLVEQFHSIQKNAHVKPEVHFIKYRDSFEAQRIQSSLMERYESASDNKFVYTPALTSDNMPLSKNYAMNFLPTDIDVVPGTSYIPLPLK